MTRDALLDNLHDLLAEEQFSPVAEMLIQAAITFIEGDGEVLNRISVLSRPSAECDVKV